MEFISCVPINDGGFFVLGICVCGTSDVFAGFLVGFLPSFRSKVSDTEDKGMAEEDATAVIMPKTPFSVIDD